MKVDSLSRPTLTYEQFLNEVNKKINSASTYAKIDIALCQFSNIFKFVADAGTAVGAGVATATKVFPAVYSHMTCQDYSASISNFENDIAANINALGLWGLDLILPGIAAVATVGAGIGALVTTDTLINFFKNKANFTSEQVEKVKMYLEVLQKRKNNLKKADANIEQLISFPSLRKKGSKLYSQEDVERCFYLLDKYSLTTIIAALDQGILDRLELNLTADVISTINYTSSAKLTQLHGELEFVKTEAQNYFARCFDNYYNYRCLRYDYDSTGYIQKDFETNRSMTFTQVINCVYKKIDKALKVVNKEISKFEKEGNANSIEAQRYYFMRDNLKARIRKLDECAPAYEALIRDNQKEMLFNEATAQLIFEYLTYCSMETLMLAAYTGRLGALDYLNYISYNSRIFENPIPIIENGVAEIYESEQAERVRLQEACCENIAQYINHITSIETKRYA